ncbi:hypothetical protein KsCSTR_28730 [Candidatus Kuenenia stuttgartiensis]|uniref:Uncharacterized protein n=1 Tax=Kuenenia stuttgartiensis TaxID=174633 RepID=Q1Q5Y3_KUEST|nr:hypothetical protein KsCSTR_28730 [Candidatus Kuenenia stuttgartiensis]CAJ75425.1 unknown protein [Candidatus Kuenenia stuttgartiensis]
MITAVTVERVFSIIRRMSCSTLFVTTSSFLTVIYPPSLKSQRGVCSSPAGYPCLSRGVRVFGDCLPKLSPYISIDYRLNPAGMTLTL